LAAIFEVIFLSALLLFWLFEVEKIRNGELQCGLSFQHTPKVLLVLMHAILSLVIFVWIRVRASRDPVYGDHDEIIGMIIVFYFAAATMGAIVVWVAIELTLGMMTVVRDPQLLMRLAFVGTPACVGIISMLCAIFFGSFGPFNLVNSTFAYFIVLYNVTIWAMVAGFWPVQHSDNVAPETPVVPPPRAQNTRQEEGGLLAFQEEL